MTRAFHQWTIAWFVLCGTLAIHLYEEATAGARQSYGATMDYLRQLFPWLPPFHFTIWLVDVVGALLVLFALTWFVHKRRKLMLPASYALATFTTVDATLHLLPRFAGVEYFAGTQSALLLLAASLYLLLSIPRRGALANPPQSGPNPAR